MEVDKVLQRYKENYCRIFEKLYPSHGSTGFTERNLSVNFAKAYESISPDAVTWYEVQFGPKNNLHYDTMIINPTKKEIVIVESKRLSHVKKKVGEIGEDIQRIREFKTKHLAEFTDRIPDLQDYSVVGVILADIWTEGDLKPAVKDSFCKKTFGQLHLPQLFEDASWFLEGQYFCKGFADINTPNLERGNTIPTNYYLVGMIWDVK